MDFVLRGDADDSHLSESVGVMGNLGDLETSVKRVGPWVCGGGNGRSREFHRNIIRSECEWTQHCQVYSGISGVSSESLGQTEVLSSS